MAGYSSTPLPKKLGLKPDSILVTVDAPPDYLDLLGTLPKGLRIVETPGLEPSAIHLFVTRRADLAKHLSTLRVRLAQDGFVWVSWPKKASKVETDVTEDGIREVALPMGFVDVKVCAVSEIWSGLKLVIRKSERRG